PRTRAGCDAILTLVMIRAGLADYVDEPLAADRVDPPCLVVQEHIVRVAADRQRRYALPGIEVVNEQSRWPACTYVQAPSIFIERHRKVGTNVRSAPALHEHTTF